MTIFGVAIGQSGLFGLAFAGKRFRLPHYSAASTVFTNGDGTPAGCPAWLDGLYLTTTVCVDPIAWHRDTNLPRCSATRIESIRTALFGVGKLA